MRLVCLPLLVLVLLVTTACHRVSPMVGTWEAPIAIKTITGTSQLQFNEDGSYKATATFNGKGKVVVTTIGTWRLDNGDHLVTHADSMDMDLPGTAPNAQRAREAFEKSKAKLIADTNAHSTDVLTWHGGDSYSYVNQTGETRTFRRVK